MEKSNSNRTLDNKFFYSNIKINELVLNTKFISKLLKHQVKILILKN